MRRWKSSLIASADEETYECRRTRSRRTHGGLRACCSHSCSLAQAAYVYRVELAANYPGLQPALARACEALHCTVALPRQPA